MALIVTQPCYCTREEVKRSVDFMEPAARNAQIDRAIMSVARIIESEMKRVFYPFDTTYYFNWPNYQYAYPWRLWLDQKTLAAPATSVQSPPGTNLNLSAVFFEPVNSGPPYEYIELDRSQSIAWGAAPTPQRSIVVTGTFGYWLITDAAGSLAAAVSSTSATTIQVSDSTLVGVGDLLLIDTERMLVQDKSWITTGSTISGTGVTTNSAADNQLGVASVTGFDIGEMLKIDQERMLIWDIDTVNNLLIVKRAWDGSLLAAHTTGATIYAQRQLTVLRGQLGTTAATHNNSVAINKFHWPEAIHDLAIAESVNRILQETSGYSRTVGEGQAAQPAPGVALMDLWDEARTAYGRKNRIRVI